MQIPTFLLGRRSDVARACRKKAKALIEGAAWSELPDAFTDARDIRAPIVLTATSKSHMEGDCVHAYAFLQIVCEAEFGPDLHDRMVEQACGTVWGVLCLASQSGMILMQQSTTRWYSFLQRAVSVAPELEALGPRFSSLGEQSIQHVPSNLYRALGRFGVPAAEIQALVRGPTLPAGQWSEWFARKVASLPSVSSA